MRTFLASSLVLASSICTYACGGDTTSLLSQTGGADGTSGYGGTTSTGPIGSGGLPEDWDACSGRFTGGGFNCGGAGGSQNTGGATGGGTTRLGSTGGYAGAGGIGSTRSDGRASSSSVLNLSLTWATSPDAGALLYNVVVMPDGTATCSEYRGTWLLIGREGQTDPQVAALLATPGTVDALATTCPLNVADVSPTITTTFIGGSKVDRLVWASCSTDNLAELAADLRRIGELCVAVGTMIRDY